MVEQPGGLVEADGFKWINRPNTQDYLAHADHEPLVTKRLVHQQGHIFIDVGAHVGRYAVRLSQNFHWVFAFEPGASQRQGLYENLRINSVYNVIVVPFAAWSHRGMIQWHDEDARSRGGWGQDTAFAVPISDLIEKADLVKIDVEGSELQVLKGLKPMIQRQQNLPKLMIEVHESMTGREGVDLLATHLDSLHYAVEEIPYHVPGLRYWWATR